MLLMPEDEDNDENEANQGEYTGTNTSVPCIAYLFHASICFSPVHAHRNRDQLIPFWLAEGHDELIAHDEDRDENLAAAVRDGIATCDVAMRACDVAMRASDA